VSRVCCVGGKQTSFPLCCLDQMAREFGEDHCELRPLVDIQSEFVVAATEVLHKRVPGTDHPCRAEPFHAAHRPQPAFRRP
jgi:hypothetical protein